MTRSRSAKNPLFGEDELQLGLFDSPADDAPDSTSSRQEELAKLGARLTDKLRFGTSSWTFPGWAGLVYQHHRNVFFDGIFAVTVWLLAHQPGFTD